VFHIDDWNIVQTDYIVQAFLLNPCADHGPERQEWAIGLTLHVANKAIRCALTYPAEGYRNAAFEHICQLLRETYELDTADEEDRYDT
jgi:hypothetical protein